MALGVLFGLVVGFSGVLTAAAGESDFLIGDGEEERGSFGEVPSPTLLEDPTINGLGDPEEITFGEPGIGLGELLVLMDDPATPLTLFFLNVSLARRLLGGEEELTFDSTEAICSAASAFVVGGVPPVSVPVPGAALVVVFVGRVSDFFAIEGEGGRGGLIFSELLVPLPLPTVPILLRVGLVFAIDAGDVVCFELLLVVGGGGRGLLGGGTVGECAFDALPLLAASKRALSLLISEAMLSTTHLVTIITNSCVLLSSQISLKEVV
jgi:hypothetical protein